MHTIRATRPCLSMFSTPTKTTNVPWPHQTNISNVSAELSPRACGDVAATCGNHSSWTFVAQRHGIALWWSRLPAEAMWMIQSSGRYSLKEVKCEFLIEAAMPTICWRGVLPACIQSRKANINIFELSLKGPTTIATSLTGKGLKW